MFQTRYTDSERRLEELRGHMRDSNELMKPERLGAVRLMRYSFARTFIRYATRHRWKVERASWKFDDEGRGEAIYTVGTHERPLHFVVFSDRIEEDKRTDRVVAEAWDVTAALCEGELTAERLAEMRREVPKQEGGRADPKTLAWTRGNRSARFFDYVIECLARGEQPDPEVLGDDGYMLRSTAFYANGKFGTTPFRALGPEHPVSSTYRAQMLAAWLFREFSYDLAEHCARARNPEARQLEGSWKRYFGIGNATGLGMVPFFINHPRIIHAWCTVRELALANATLAKVEPDDPEIARMLELTDRCTRFFREREAMNTHPFTLCGELADGLVAAREIVAEFAAGGTVLGERPERPWEALRGWAKRELRAEEQELVNTLLIELYDDLDEPLEELLEVRKQTNLAPQMPTGRLREIVERDYAWAFEFDFNDPDETYYFWYISSNSEEPRRDVRGEVLGEEHEQPFDIARQLQRLHEDLRETPGDASVAVFLLKHPQHRSIVERIQTFHHLPYGEVHTNLMGVGFLPLHLQKFKLAMYGMENYSPKSTDWLRVTLMQGAPRTEDVAEGEEDDWIFPIKPEKEDSC